MRKSWPAIYIRIPSGHRDVFKEEMQSNQVLYRVSIVVDVSGSMDGAKRKKAIEAAVMLAETLEGIRGVQYEIVVYDSAPFVVKAYNEVIKNKRDIKDSIIKAMMERNGSTEAHVAVAEAIQRARMGRGEWLMFVINDGDPDSNFDRHKFRAMIRSANDGEVHGFGLGDYAQLVEELFPHGRGWWLPDVGRLARKMRTILMKKIMKRSRN